jgi:hypothetical protein
MTVEIDVADDEHLVEQAAAVGCTAVEQKVFCMGGTYVYRVTGEPDVLLPLLDGWGYPDAHDYRVIE